MTTKIVHLISDLSTGGAEMMLFRLISRMDRSKFNNVIISLSDLGTLGHQIEALGLPVYTLGKQRVPQTRSLGPKQVAYLLTIGMWRLLRILRREKPIILQTWLYHSDLLGILMGKLAKIPVVLWNLRCTKLRHDRFMAVWLLAVLSRLPQAVIVNSIAGRHFHESLGYCPKRWVHIPNGFDLDQFRPEEAARLTLRKELGLSEDVQLIGLITRQDPLKDHGNFIEAVRLFERSHKDVHFVLVGWGMTEKNEEILKAISRRQIVSRIHMMGERRDVPYIMAGLDVLTTSSRSEGFPNVVGEAMACAIPCVVTDVGDSALLVGETGKIVAPEDPHALAQAWREIIDMPLLERRKLGLKARERIRRQYSLEHIVQMYEVCYETYASSTGFLPESPLKAAF